MSVRKSTRPRPRVDSQPLPGDPVRLEQMKEAAAKAPAPPPPAEPVTPALAEPVTLKVGTREWRLIPTPQRRPAGLQFGEGCFVDGSDRIYLTPDAGPREIGDCLADLIEAASAGGRAGHDPAESDADPEPHSDDWWLLQDQVRFLEVTIDRTQPEAAAVVARLEAVMEYANSIETEDDPPPAADLINAVAPFYALPEEVQRRLLKGWSMKAWPHRVDDIFRFTTYRAALVMEPGGNHPYELRLRAHHALVTQDHNSPVHLIVKAGTSQGGTLAALDAMREDIERRWSYLVTRERYDAVAAR